MHVFIKYSQYGSATSGIERWTFRLQVVMTQFCIENRSSFVKKWKIITLAPFSCQPRGLNPCVTCSGS
eukprot:932875-Amphidinium_carterae.1